MNITRITASPRTWIISYKYWLGNRIGSNKKTRTVTVNSTWKPTRAAAMRYALDDLLALLGHSKGQYGYTGLKIDFISKLDPVLTSTKQPAGTQSAIAETGYRPVGAVFV